MRRLVFALLCGLVLVPLPVHAQGSVTLNVCNMGKVDIDVFVSLSNSHIRPATCAAVAESEGATEPAHVGLAFADSRGQWGAARRFSGLPALGTKKLPTAMQLAMALRREKVPPQPYVLTLATRSETVRRGNVSVPMQLLFQPSIPDCTTVRTGGGATVGRTTIVEVTNICEHLGYTLMVEAYADSREIRLEWLSISGHISDGPVARISEKPIVDWAELEAERKAREAPQPVNVSDLQSAIDRARSGAGTAQFTLPDYIVIRGTVSGVEIRQRSVDATTNIPVAEINFRESPPAAGRPNPEFNVCTERLDILQDMFGADFRTSLIGKVIEVQGRPQGSCSAQSEIQIILARQVRPVPSAQFAAGTRVWVPPPSFTPAELALLAGLEEEQRRRVACAEQAFKAYDYQKRRELFVDYQNAVRACLIAEGLPAPAPAVNNPSSTGPTRYTGSIRVPPPVMSTFGTAPAPRAGALSIANFTSQWVGKVVVATGTVARVETIRGFEHLYFEGADGKFVACFTQGFGGVKNASELIGKTIEVSARIDSPAGCLDHRVGTVGATEIRQLNQLRLIGGAVSGEGQPSSVGAPVAAPAAAPEDSVAAGAKALQDQQQRPAQDGFATQQKSAQDAQQRAQKAQACMQQLFKTYPDGGRSDPTGFQKGFLACAQAQQAQPAAK